MTPLGPMSDFWLNRCANGLGFISDEHGREMALEIMASRRLIERVRRWVSDHPIDPDHPCHCGLCTALRRYATEGGP